MLCGCARVTLFVTHRPKPSLKQQHIALLRSPTGGRKEGWTSLPRAAAGRPEWLAGSWLQTITLWRWHLTVPGSWAGTAGGSLNMWSGRLVVQQPKGVILHVYPQVYWGVRDEWIPIPSMSRPRHQDYGFWLMICKSINQPPLSGLHFSNYFSLNIRAFWHCLTVFRFSFLLIEIPRYFFFFCFCFFFFLSAYWCYLLIKYLQTDYYSPVLCQR